MKTSPTSKRNPKNAPLRSDSAQKCAAKQRIRHKTRAKGCSGGPPGIAGSPKGSPAPHPSGPDPASAERPDLGRSLPGLARFARQTDQRPPTRAEAPDRRPRGAGHRRGPTRLTPRLPPPTPRLLTPPIAHTEARGRASSRSYPPLHDKYRSPTINALCTRATAGRNRTSRGSATGSRP